MGRTQGPGDGRREGDGVGTGVGRALGRALGQGVGAAVGRREGSGEGAATAPETPISPKNTGLVEPPAPSSSGPVPYLRKVALDRIEREKRVSLKREASRHSRRVST